MRSLLEADVRMQSAAKEYAARYTERGVPKAVEQASGGSYARRL